MNPQTILRRDEQAIFSLRELYRRFGYLPYKMSRFEEYDLYVRNKDFLVSDQIITFSDRNGKLLALKPDVTLSIIKNSPDEPGKVQKLYYDENVYRADKSSHTFKEILQTGLECIGDLGSYEIAEVVLLAARSLSLLQERFVLDISHMGLVRAVLESCGVREEDRGEVLQCLHQKNTHEIARFVSGKNLQKLQLLTDTSGKAETVLSVLESVLSGEAEQKALLELRQLWNILRSSGFGDSVRLDFSVGNDMKYYSGVVFKGYLEGIPSSILSGGQYDKLLRKMGRNSRAIGFALYLDLLQRQNTGILDVDTLILHDPDADPGMLIAAAEKAAEAGTVLVSTAIPDDRNWGDLLDLRGGKDNG